MNERVLIFGAGNWMYGDEAAGIMIANELGRRLGKLARVCYDTKQLGEAADESDTNKPELIIVTTTAEENEEFPAGRWCRVDFPEPRMKKDQPQEDKAPQMPSLIALENRLGDSAKRVWVYAVAGEEKRLGAPLSFPVRETLESLESRIEDDIKSELGLDALHHENARSVAGSR